MNCDLFDLTGQTAVVLGGTGTLGGAMSIALASAGAQVAILGRNNKRAEEKHIKAIEAFSGKAFFVHAEALSAESLREARAKVLSTTGSIDILINAAGGNNPQATLSPGDEFSDLPLDAWLNVFNLNLVGGTLLPSQIFGEAMLEQKRGSIINIASMSGMIPLSRVVAYSAAKAAVLNLTQFLAREWAQRGVRVNAISPGFFPAEQNKKLLYNDDGSYSERGGQIINHTPAGRFGEADELGGAVIWLASHKASSFVTGQNIVVDGGFSATTI